MANSEGPGTTRTATRRRPSAEATEAAEAAEAAEDTQDTSAGVETQTRPDVRTATVRLPFAAVSLSVPRRVTDSAARATEVVAANAPSPDKMVFYAGLGLLAAFEVLEWPVAAAVAAGTFVAQRGQVRMPGSALPAAPRAERPATA